MGQPELPHAGDHTLISASRVKGTDVYDREGSHIGRITDIMLSKREGNIAYLVMSSGGLFGIGGEVHPLPWNALTYDTAIEGYRIGMSSEHLQDAPSFAPERLSGSHSEAGEGMAADMEHVNQWYDTAEREGRMDARDRTPFVGGRVERGRVLGGLGAPAGTSGGQSGASGVGRSGL